MNTLLAGMYNGLCVHASRFSRVCGLLQARILEWVAPSGGLPDPWIKAMSLMSPALA